MIGDEIKGSVQELYIKTIGFFQKHGDELDQVRQLLDIRLTQLALAYTNENRLPSESIQIKTRVKSFSSFLKKMERLNLSDFNYPEDVLYDLIGARLVCWFLDDCKGISQCIINSNFLSVNSKEIFNYIDHPKPSGYRGIHLHARVEYESMSTTNCKVKVKPLQIKCEVQLRTKLMDAWADLTHEFHYKAGAWGATDEQLERVLEAQSKRLLSEDESFIAMRDLYQKMLSENQNRKFRP